MGTAWVTPWILEVAMNTLPRVLRKRCASPVRVEFSFNEPLEHQPQGLPRRLLLVELQQKRRLHLILYLYNTVLLSTIACGWMLTSNTRGMIGKTGRRQLVEGLTLPLLQRMRVSWLGIRV